VVALPGGKVRVEPYQDPEEDTSWRDPAWGEYKQRGSVMGMPIMVGRLSICPAWCLWLHVEA
jgi:hypothetical protein